VATAAEEDAMGYAQERHSFGQPIWKHRAISHYLADMATKLIAARQLTHYAARRYDSGERADMEAAMAKLFASEVAMEIALCAVRIHGGYGYSTEFDVERYFRHAADSRRRRHQRDPTQRHRRSTSCPRRPLSKPTAPPHGEAQLRRAPLTGHLYPAIHLRIRPRARRRPHLRTTRCSNIR
jgi:hypothetical protein